jgi:hypothetical protein
MEILEFKTASDWTVDEWNTCLVSVSKIYNVFLSMEIVKEYETNISESFAFNRLTVAKVLENLPFFVDDNAKLRIHKVIMASPGGFSLQGSGEIIKEAREFITRGFELIGVTTKKTDTENDINKATANKINAEANKADAEAEKIRADAKKTDAETENIKIENEGKKYKLIGDNLILGTIIMNYLNEDPLFKELHGKDDGQYDHVKKVIFESLYAGFSGLLTLKDNGKLYL